MAEQDYATVDGVKVPKGEFGYALGDEPSKWKFPLDTMAHADSAIDLFHHEKGIPPEAMAALKRKIIERAHGLGVDAEKIKRFEARAVSASEVRNGLVKLAVAYTGDFTKDDRDFTITASDLDAMKKNLSEREVPIDYEHLSADKVPPGWSKAAGWLRKPGGIETMSDGRKALFAWAELTPAVLAMVKQKEYRYFSPEIHWNDEDEHGNALGTRLKAGAITNRPFLKDLPPIEISDADYQNLFGLAARDDGKLAMVALSERSEKLISVAMMEAQQVHVAAAIGKTNATEKEKTMALKKLKLKRVKDGEHKGKIAAFADDNEMMGEVDPSDFKSLDDADGDGPGPKGFGAKVAASEALLVEIGAQGKTLTEVKTLIERGAGVNQEAKLLSEIVGDNGKIDVQKLDELVDSAQLKPSSTRRALEAEARVAAAFQAGKIHPQETARALRLCLSDAESFKAFIEDRAAVVDTDVRGVVSAAESGAAKQMLSEVVRKRMEETGEPHDLAELSVLRTKEGLALWEAVRREELAEK